MKKIGLKKGITICLGLILIFSFFAIPASASTAKREAMLEYKNIKVTLDGKEIIPKDANGAVIEPFVIDGTTYLPVRGLANALNLGVAWDGDTNTVILNSPSTALTVVDATLIETEEGIYLAMRFRNNLADDIKFLQITIYGYDADNKPIMTGTTNTLRAYTETVQSAGSNGTYSRWPMLPELPGLAYAEFAVTKYTTADGTEVDVPFDQQIRYNVSK